MADSTPVSKEALDRVETRLSARIEDNAKHIKENIEAIVELKTLYKTLIKLPDTIASLDKAIIQSNHNMEVMATRIDIMNNSIQSQRESIEALKAENQKQNETISAVDNKSKIDWAKAVTQNFWKVILAICGVIVAYKSLTGI